MAPFDRINARWLHLPFCLFLIVTLITTWTPPACAQGGLSLSGGVALGYVGASAHAKADGPRATLDADTVLSPFLRGEYALTPSLSLDVTGCLDLYSGTLTHQTGEGTSSLRGYSLSAGPTWYGGKRAGGALLKSWQPSLHAGIRYQGLRSDLDYPVTAFDDAWGVDLAAGIRKGNWGLRLRGTFATHDNKHTRPGFDAAASSDDLDLSAISLELAWRFTEFPQP